ncbi:histidine kinase dimerization/phosphoacceptor domain -containing protein [Desulfobacterales bacterium HSG2]|nr:histidine kinase dimerization/phosphoacceptor domain -containing protein [Desulfobacterales bacterium HSG2]
MNNSLQFLKRVRFFKSLPDSDIIKIENVCQEKRFEAEEVIFVEGSLGNNFFIILEGSVEIWKGFKTPNQDSLGVFGPGQLFGELALIDGFPRSATVVSRESSLLLSIHRDDFNKVLAESRTITLSIMKSLAAMIRESTENFIEDLRARNRHLEEANKQLRESEERIAASLREKEILLAEIHHRVKNNLQIVTSLLNLQSDQLKDRQVYDIFQKSRNRVRAMALVHETLFLSSDLSCLDSGTYIRKLAATLMRTAGIPHQRIRMETEADDILLNLDDAVPVGLIINELITNSLRYAFPDSTPGEIRISTRLVDEDQVELSVCDNGTGFPPGFDFRRAETLGLTLVKGLTEEQLEGSLRLDQTRGTRFTIRFRQKKLMK